MERIKFSDFIKKPEMLPQASGIFVLHDKEYPLYVKTTENLRRFVGLYSDKNSKEPNIQELEKQIHYIDYQIDNVLIDLFIKELLFINKNNPPFNKILKPWQHYVYLGINFDGPSFMKLCEDTTESHHYLGPFRSAFILNDILDVFAEYFKMPRCGNSEIENFGCNRLLENLCLGFCQNKLKEALPEMLNRMMMIPNKALIGKMIAEHEALLNDLEFEKADTIKSKITLLKKYYKNILFCYTSQFIIGEFDVCGNTIKVVQGMIYEIVSKDTKNSSTCICVEERDRFNYLKNNELLAYEKSEYDHRWLVFDFLYNTKPEYIEELFMENVVHLQKKMFLNKIKEINNDR